MISRKQFIQAVQAGISYSPTLTERQRDALRQVAVSTKHTGNSFNSGCPWAQAFGFDMNSNENQVGRAGRDFSNGYDDAMMFGATSGRAFNQVVVD